MKINLLIAMLLICGTVNAQMLKLKPGQKFSYDAINSSDRKAKQYSSNTYEYWKTNFEVISHKNGIYTLKASPEIFLTKWGDGIHDSTVPFEEQPAVFMAVAKKVMTISSYELKIDEKGNITTINGIPEIRAAIMAKLKALNIPEGYEKHQKLLEVVASEDYFKERLPFFKHPVRSFNRDTTVTQRSPEGAEMGTTHTITKFNLITTSKDKFIGLSTPLMSEAKAKLNYADYYTPFNKATRKIQELANQHHREKGSQTVEAEILKQLDSLDKGFAKDDYRYLGAKLGVLTYLNGGNYQEILEKVPYESLPGENDIDNKMRADLGKGDLSKVKRAIELSFTKFKGKDYYPLNMPNTANSIHENFGGLIFRTQDQATLQTAYNIIKDLEELKIQIVTDMLTGLKTYVQAKLSTDQAVLAAIANTHFNTAYDKAGLYRILIYDELVKKQVPDSIKSAYIDYTIDLIKKKMDQIDSGSIENIPSFIFKTFITGNKIIYKKNLADAYYRKSKLDRKTEESYLQMAADYLPTQQDIVDNEFGLKSEYKFTPFVPYTDLYLASGGSTGMNDEAKLNKYVDMVILEPERYTTLKENYLKAYPNGDFKAFFNSALKSKLPVIPTFSLNERSGKTVANKDHENKFVFVDFWGTWCGACVAEIDRIEAIHLKNPNPEKLVVTTIACYDKKKNVDDFMAKEKYSYQVLMSDGKVEKDFKIRGYPTKLLLLPNGVYVTISFFSNYEDILSKYLKWEI
ncbi:TlpA disulfide reductase family protein [Pedobacter sp. B4-66]|uniref:TlpA family protein disulfide reductase n=1 Tax=Pedobacter sp. B4-66 TaxID=2817280 RepID=UPI001BDB1CB5|nr:TlpA disulfide reductase family protein [Pedobacter sp. B4-66]